MKILKFRYYRDEAGRVHLVVAPEFWDTVKTMLALAADTDGNEVEFLPVEETASHAEKKK